MSDKDDIPMLNDLIERGAEITMSDLGLADHADDPPLRVSDVITAEAEAQARAHENTELEFAADQAAPFTAAVYTRDTPSTSASAPESLPDSPPRSELLADNPALEQAVRRILDEHMELAWQEIRLAIQQHLDRS
jgi:hypothetical protein